jgi:hypothetical protein
MTKTCQQKKEMLDKLGELQHTQVQRLEQQVE